MEQDFQLDDLYIENLYHLLSYRGLIIVPISQLHQKIKETSYSGTPQSFMIETSDKSEYRSCIIMYIDQTKNISSSEFLKKIIIQKQSKNKSINSYIVIIVAHHTITDKIIRKVDKIRKENTDKFRKTVRIDIISTDDLLFNRRQSVGSCLFYPISQEELQFMIERQCVNIVQDRKNRSIKGELPVIHNNDPLVLYYGFEAGDCIISKFTSESCAQVAVRLQVQQSDVKAGYSSFVFYM